DGARNPGPPSRRAGEDAEYADRACGVPEGLCRRVEPGQVAARVAAPDDSGGVRSGQRVAETSFGAPPGDGCAVENQRHGLASFGVRASGELVALQVDLGRDGRQGRVDECTDRPGADVE